MDLTRQRQSTCCDYWAILVRRRWVDLPRRDLP